MTISQMQNKVDQWIKEYGVRYFDPLTNMVLLMEEVGELARLMARKHGEQSWKNKNKEKAFDLQLGDEIADIFFVLTCIANQSGVDLTKEISKNLSKKTSRDVDRHQTNPKLTNK